MGLGWPRWGALVAALAAALLAADRWHWAKCPSDAEGTAYSALLAFGNYRRNADAMADFARQAYAADAPFAGKRVLLTGASRGLGLGLAAHLHALGAELVLPCRGQATQLEDTVRQRAAALRELWGASGATTDAAVHILKLDLADLDSVDALAEAVAKQFGAHSLDALVNNAGLQKPFVELTKQGFETTFAVNFLGPARLTLRVLELQLLRHQERRPVVLNVGSEDHRNYVWLNSTGVPFGAPWGSGLSDALLRYGNSKLAMTTFTAQLAREASNLTALDICPGPVASDIARGLGPFSGLITALLRALFVPPEEAALPLLRLLLDPRFEALSGAHFHMAEQRPPRSDVLDLDTCRWLWNHTNALLQSRKPPSSVPVP